MRKTWKEIVTKYPDKWVVLQNVSFSNSDIIDAEIVDVKNDDEIIEFQEEHFDQKYVYRRTTDIAATGYIETNFEISIE